MTLLNKIIFKGSTALGNILNHHIEIVILALFFFMIVINLFKTILRWNRY